MSITKHIKLYNFIETHFLSILLVLFYFTEGYSKYIVIINGERPNLAKLVKIGVLCFIIVKLFKNHRLLKQIIAITLCFVLGQLFINPSFDFVVLGVFLKYLFPILLFAYFNQNKIKLKALEVLQKIFEGLLLMNCLLIFIGFIFEVQFLKTYGSRFGYNGLFVSSATGTYVYLITLLYFLLKYKESFIYNIKVIVVILTCLLIGTKSLYLSVAFILMFYFIFYTHKRQRILGISVMLLIVISSIYYALFVWDTFMNLRLREGLLTSILSYRNKLFIEKTIPFIKSNWTFVNYLFGGVNIISTRSQMGFFDTFYFFGLVGGIIYLWSYIDNFIKFKLTKEIFVCLLLISIVVFITGNFFLNASVVVYLLIIRELMIKHK